MFRESTTTIITPRMKRYISWRIHIMAYFSCASAMEWNSKSEECVPSKWFIHWNGGVVVYSGFGISALFVYHAYTKIINQNQKNGDFFSTDSIAPIILSLIISIFVFMMATTGSRLIYCSNNVNFLLNQMFRYSIKIEEMMKRKRFSFTGKQIRSIKYAEYLIIMGVVGSTIFPLCYGVFLTSNMEPVHNLVRDWLEVEISLDHLPFLVLSSWAATNGGSPMFVVVMVVVLYVWQANICLSSLMISNIIGKDSDSKFTTISFGILDELEVINFFRTQQMFNIFANEIFATVAIAVHQAAGMVFLVGITYVFITVPEILFQEGWMTTCFLLGAFGTVWLVIGLECLKLAEFYETCGEFVRTSKHFCGRRTPLRKYLNSFPNLSFKTTDPFYTIKKTTFGEFFCQYLDFLVQLLMSQKYN
ncbi:unnamed protein product [Orchesella dallaii]|uniref:Odorant receptor n=1 Tax=Orchesella dallaii TaxID=48710 RepID=A0ABP1PSV2_9HEXA